MGLKSAADCYRHAIKRARERYGVYFTEEEIRRMGIRIQENGATFLLTESRSRTHWLVDDQFIVVYNKKLKAVTTFLPPECIYNYIGREA